MSDSVYSIKCVVLGDSSVGKTSLVLRYVTNTFKLDTDNTVGASYLTKTLNIDSSIVKLNIWDTAGQERYRSLIRLYYKDIHLAILVYDITELRSYHNLKNWYKDLIEQAQTDMPVHVVIVANKEDLASSEAVNPNEAMEYANSIGASYYRTSCKEDSGVTKLFQDIVVNYLATVRKSRSTREILSTTHELRRPRGDPNKGGCC